MSTTESQKSSEDLDLDYTQGLRKRLLNLVVKDLKTIPEDKADKSMIIQLLDGMDRQALSKLRIKSDEGSADKQSAAAATIAHLIATGSIINNRTDKGAGVIPQLDDLLPVPFIVEGELDTPIGTNASNVSNLDYDSFMVNRPVEI